jgi:hypothetical protein
MRVFRNICARRVAMAGMLALCVLPRAGAVDGVKPAEFTPVIDANGVVIGWLGEQNAEDMQIDTKERAYRLPLPGGGFTMFTVQAIPGDRSTVEGLAPVTDSGPGRHQPGINVALRIEVKAGEPLEVLMPEGVTVSIPAATVALLEFQVERLGKGGGALSSMSGRELYTRRIVTGFVRIETIVGGPIIGTDPGEAPRPVTMGEAVVFDVRNFFLPTFNGTLPEARLTVVGSVEEKKKKKEPEPVTP